MDLAQQPAAGSRPQKQTYDQAVPTREMQEKKFYNNLRKYNNSNIFSDVPAVTKAPPSRGTVRASTDIFNTASAAQKQSDVRVTNTQKSSIFNYDEAPTNTHSNMRNSQTFQNSNQVQKGFQGKNSEFKPKDHDANFLYGKTDFDDYKSLKRVSTANEFKPKLDFNPAERKYYELHGTEIARDHLQSKTGTMKPNFDNKTSKKQQPLVQVDPSLRKQLENQSTVFGDSPVRASPVKQAQQDKLTASTQKWSNAGGSADNSNKEFDPDTYAKNRKEKELESSVFGNEPKPKVQKQQEPQEEKKEKPAKQKPKDRLIPNNQTWQQTDSIKNKKDFQPGESQISEVNATPIQKKHDTLKSTLDNHQFQANSEVVPKNDKISHKNLKYKGDILSRDDKPKKEKAEKVQKEDNDQPPQKQQAKQKQPKKEAAPKKQEVNDII